VDADGKPLRLLLNTQGCQTGTHRVVLKRNWRAEYRHDAVAGETADRAAVALHHRSRTLDQLGHDLAQPLWPDGCGDVHRMHHIGEQHRHLLVLGRSADLYDRCTALVTELGVRWQFGGSSVPHDPHGSPAAVSAPRPSSMPVSFHRWSAIVCHIGPAIACTARSPPMSAKRLHGAQIRRATACSRIAIRGTTSRVRP
jgi:hypothetical protein